MTYILFYSSLCKHSLKFVKILEKSQVSKFFIKILVDVDPETNMRPEIIYRYGVKEVPTIIVDDIKLPGAEAFEWLEYSIKNEAHSISTRQNKPQESLREYTAEKTTEVKEYEPNKKFGDSFLQLEKDKRGYVKVPVGDMTPKELRTKDYDPLAPINVKKDSLKSKQCNNAYNKLLKERDLA